MKIFINKIFPSFLLFAQNFIRAILNFIENFHHKFYQVMNSQNYISKLFFSKIISFEQQLKTYSPYTLICFGVFLIFLYYIMKKILELFKTIINFFLNIKENAILIYTKFPSVKREMEKTKIIIKEQFKKGFKSDKFKKIEFRDNKQDYTKILLKMEQNMSADRIKCDCGKLTGAVYCNDEKIKYIGGEAFKMFLYSNLLHTDLYSYCRYMESELIKIGLDLFYGKEDSCGMTTNGGTMSIITAIFAYVERGKKLGITQPELIIPISAHAAFEKACRMFNIKCVKIPLDKKTYQIDLKLLKKNINKNTICIVGSFPNFPHCVCDDIESLSEIALKNKVPLHVDCCLGGFLVAFHERAGITTTPKFDFRLEGVTSISADLHKYGLCPKGISLILFANHEIRRNIYFLFPHWMGGAYLTPSFEGSRTGGLVASSFAIMTSMGKEFYANNAKKIYDAVIKVKNFIRKECDLIEVIGEPYICGVSFKGKFIPYFYDLLNKKGYNINYLGNPEAIGYIFTSANVDNVDQYIKDLKEVNDIIKNNKPDKISDETKFYGLSFSLPESIAKYSMDYLGDAMLD
jgi:sphinganine-1-phosphate aldolase